MPPPSIQLYYCFCKSNFSIYIIADVDENVSQFNFQDVDEDTIRKIIDGFPQKKSFGFDGITLKQLKYLKECLLAPITLTSQVTRATHVRNRVCPRVELILKIIIILLIIFLGFIKSKPC